MRPTGLIGKIMIIGLLVGSTGLAGGVVAAAHVTATASAGCAKAAVVAKPKLNTQAGSTETIQNQITNCTAKTEVVQVKQKLSPAHRRVQRYVYAGRGPDGRDHPAHPVRLLRHVPRDRPGLFDIGPTAGHGPGRAGPSPDGSGGVHGAACMSRTSEPPLRRRGRQAQNRGVRRGQGHQARQGRQARTGASGRSPRRTSAGRQDLHDLFSGGRRILGVVQDLAPGPAVVPAQPPLSVIGGNAVNTFCEHRGTRHEYMQRGRIGRFHRGRQAPAVQGSRKPVQVVGPRMIGCVTFHLPCLRRSAHSPRRPGRFVNRRR